MEPNLRAVNNAANKYGWFAIGTDENQTLCNKKGDAVATIHNRKGKYIVNDTGGNKLLSGSGQLEKSIDKLLTSYWYCKPV